MNYREAVEALTNTAWHSERPGLERCRELLARLGDPQNKWKAVHIAGTNGKGSASAMTASVLRAAGYKTGLYTSPYLYRFNERMCLNGEQIGDEALAGFATAVCEAADAMEDHPTAFEMMTATAFLWFAAEKCDIAVLEVGLGGRFDATNTIPCPEAAVIMNIGLDHTRILGSTVAEIAAEKAGIIKPGCDCVLYQQSEEVSDVIREICRSRGATLHETDYSLLSPEFDSLDGQVFTYRGRPFAIPLLGACQRRNAAVVIELAEILRSKGWKISENDLEHGLYAVSWPARFEVLSDDPCFVLDGGHNPQCADAVVENLDHYFPDMAHILLVGALRDKDYSTLFTTLDASADAYFCVSPSSPRALGAEELAEFLRKFGKPVTVCRSIEDGVEEAKESARTAKGMVCAVGSLYMAGAIRACFGCY